MIRRLMLAALAEGMQPLPSWSSQRGLIYDVRANSVAEGEFLAILPQRSGPRASDVPGYLCEKGVNLQPGSAYRNAQAALAERWAAETGHALPQAVAGLLRSDSAMPDDARWVAFALNGKTCATLPELHPLLYREVAPRFAAGDPDVCVGCGELKPIVDLHDGVSAMGNTAPVLVSWNRGVITNRGKRRNGGNLPTCQVCMYLYVAWLNRHVSYHHQTKRHSFVLDGQRWFLSANVRAGYVCDVIDESPTALLWESVVEHQTVKREKTMSQDREARWSTKLAAIDRIFAETRDPNYLLGYMYGVLEWATWVLRIPCPSLTDVASAPARHVAPLILACHDAALRYVPPPKPKRGRPLLDTPPASTRSVVRAWLDHVMLLVTTRVTALREDALLVNELATYALGYAHSLRERGPRRESFDMDEGPINGVDPTPWAKRLGWELVDRGVAVEWEYKVFYTRRNETRERHVRIDLAVLDAKLAIEADGRLRGLVVRKHDEDSRKSAVLLAQGWRVQRVPNTRLNRPDDIEEVADEIVAILATIRGAAVLTNR